nr:hypothetical protein [Tanacetum cinerariifolium]
GRYSKSASWLFSFMLQVHSSFKLSEILNREWAVLPDGKSNDAIPKDATAKTILSCKRRMHAIDFQRKVLPVPPFESLRGMSCDISFQNFYHNCVGSDTSQNIRICTNNFLSSSDEACKVASSKAVTHSWSLPISPKASHAALFVGNAMSLTLRISRKDLQPF